MDLGRGLLLNHFHILAIKVVPFHRDAVTKSLAGADRQLKGNALHAMLFACGFEGEQLVLGPWLIFAARQLLDIHERVAVDPFEVNGVAHEDREDGHALVGLRPGVLQGIARLDCVFAPEGTYIPCTILLTDRFAMPSVVGCGSLAEALVLRALVVAGDQ
nr:hypothetical protein [Rhodovulum sulfidophilum]